MPTTYTVDNTGGGTHLTIAAALAVVVAGDTVLITDGQTFAEGDLTANLNSINIIVKRTPGFGFATNTAGDGPPIIDATGFGRAVQFETGWLIEGIHAQNSTSHAWQAGAGPPTGVTFRWLIATACGGLIDDGGDNCKIELAICAFCVGELDVILFSGTTGNLVRSVLTYRSQGRIRASVSNGVLERCVWANGDAAATGFQLVAAAVDGIARNCIVFNPGTGNDGIAANINGYSNCCVLLDDPTRTAFSGHVLGAPPDTGIEADPLFVDDDPGTNDYHLAHGSPCRNTGTAEAEAFGIGGFIDLDGDAFQRNNRLDIGPYGSVWGAGVIVRGLIKGTHLADLIASTAIWRLEAESAHRWLMPGFAFLGDPPAPSPYVPTRVARATIDLVDPRILHLQTDVPMLEGIRYSPLFDANLQAIGPIFFGTMLDAAGVDFFLNGPDTAGEAPILLSPTLVPDLGFFSVFGGRASKLDLADDRAVFLDFDAPIFDDDGFGGGWRIGDDGQYILVGGVDTIIKVVWATLLTRKGELTHDVTIGTRLRIKEPIPNLADEERFLAVQLRAIPFVVAARVTLSRPVANAIDVAVEVVTEIGLIRTRRTVSRSLTA